MIKISFKVHKEIQLVWECLKINCFCSKWDILKYLLLFVLPIMYQDGLFPKPLVLIVLRYLLLTLILICNLTGCLRSIVHQVVLLNQHQYGVIKCSMRRVLFVMLLSLLTLSKMKKEEKLQFKC